MVSLGGTNTFAKSKQDFAQKKPIELLYFLLHPYWQPESKPAQNYFAIAKRKLLLQDEKRPGNHPSLLHKRNTKVSKNIFNFHNKLHLPHKTLAPRTFETSL
jgi:hypothetical protein